MSPGDPAYGQTTRLPFTDWMHGVQARVESALARHLPPAEAIPARLHQAMRYATLNGGKRVRPLLVFAAGELNDAPLSRLEVAACAVELIHSYSLVHDDLPCMDDDVLRRGRPTCHVEYDEATALLVGDSLQALAFEVLARFDFADGAQQIEMLALLARASGSCGMAGGQAIDLAAVGRTLDQPELELMHALKTGALIRAGTASTVTLGKTAGKDAAAAKPTYVSLMGLERARDFAADLARQALAALRPFGERSRRLVELTDFITQRKF